MSAPVIFVRIHQGQIVDVCCEDPAVQVFVIDEDKLTSEIEHEDGSTFGAEVTQIQVTAPHFEPADILNASVGTTCNGVFEPRAEISPVADVPKSGIGRSL
jgi:hypothetical protein